MFMKRSFIHKTVSIFHTIICFSALLHAQPDSSLHKLSSFVAHINSFNRAYPQEKVYLHFDNAFYYQGETIRFKAYVVNASSHHPTHTSAILYVELLNDFGMILDTKKLKITDGQCHGDLELKEGYRTGFYQVRAYTRNMLNFGNEKRPAIYFKTNSTTTLTYDQTVVNDGNFTIFSRVFPVYCKPLSPGDYGYKRMETYFPHRLLTQHQSKSEKQSDPLRIAFYPEGGNLVTGVESVVAFEARDREGRYLDVNGVILDSRKERVCRFESIHKGRGYFRITPDGKKYTARIEYEGKIHHFPLPESIAAGYVIHLEDTPPDRMEISVAKSQNTHSQLMGIAISCRGKVTAFDTLTLRNTEVRSLNIPVRNLTPGVNQLTLFDRKGQVMAERLFFVYPPGEQNRLRLTEMGDTLKPYEPVRLDFRLTDGEEKPLEGSFSLSVTDKSNLSPSFHSGHIATELLLASDLKGFIEDASSYLNDRSPKGRSALDLLMLVQGWRRYAWREMAGIDDFKMKYMPEKHFLIDGYVAKVETIARNESIINGNLNKRLSGVTVSIELVRDSLTFTAECVTDSKGRFRFELDNDLYGTAGLTLRLTKKGKVVREAFPVIDRAFSPDIDPYSYYEDHLPLSIKEFSFDHDLEGFVAPFELGEVMINSKKKSAPAINFQAPELVLDMAREADLTMDRGVIMELIVDLCFSYTLVRTRGGLLGKGALFDDSTWIKKEVEPWTQRLDRVKTVKAYSNQLIPGRAFLFNNRRNKPPLDDIAFAVKWHPNGFFRPDNTNGERNTVFEGYSYVKEFYNPDYSRTALPGDRADFRRTLYWNPYVITDKDGRASVLFYNNGTCKELDISAEGMTKDGGLIVFDVNNLLFLK